MVIPLRSTHGVEAEPEKYKENNLSRQSKGKMYLLNAQNGPTAIPFHCSGLDVLIVLNLRFTDYRFVGSDADIGRLVIALNVLCQRGNGRRVGHFEMQQLPGDRIRSIGASSSTLPSGIHSVFVNFAFAVAVSKPETCNALRF